MNSNQEELMYKEETYPYVVDESTDSIESTIMHIAKVCHEENKSYCESISDMSQPTWEDAPEWQKQSACDGVKYFLENPDVTPEDMHDNWLHEKIRTGWHYGEEKNTANKTHPCMVMYWDLPEEQRMKDTIFMQTIKTLISA